jgi:hypothetical protein
MPVPVQRQAKGQTTGATITMGSGDGWSAPTAGNTIVVTANSDATVTITNIGTAWTSGPNIVDGNGAYSWVKTSQGTETTITLTPGASVPIDITVCEYSGVDAVNIIDASNSSTVSGSSGTSTTAVSVTTIQPGDKVIAVALLHSGLGNMTSPSWTNSFTNQLTASSGGATGADVVTFYAEFDAVAPGTVTTAASWTNTCSDRQEIVIALKAAPVGSGQSEQQAIPTDLLLAILAAAQSNMSVGATSGALLDISGTVSNAATTAGSITMILAIAGTATETTTTSGALTMIMVIAGTTTETTTTVGALTMTMVIAGSTTETTTTAGTITMTMVISGSTSCTTTTTGSTTDTTGAAGSCSLTTTTTGTITEIMVISGTTSCTTTTSGVFGSAPISGTCTNTTTTSGALTLTIVIAGSASLTTTTVGAIVGLLVLAGAAASTTTTSGSPILIGRISGSATEVTVTVGAVNFPAPPPPLRPPNVIVNVGRKSVSVDGRPSTIVNLTRQSG